MTHYKRDRHISEMSFETDEVLNASGFWLTGKSPRFVLF